MEERFERYHPDMEAMHHGFRSQPCFVCKLVEGDIRVPENIIYEDDHFLTVLDVYPRAYGYTLVAPKEHREQVTAAFMVDEYLELQRLVYRVTDAVREEVGAERMYIFTFGSNEGNSHVHWHVVPLPPGVPYEEQQGKWTNWSRGVLEIPREERASLASRIGTRLGGCSSPLVRLRSLQSTNGFGLRFRVRLAEGHTPRLELTRA
jgi:diadenosine tetraphosphate (Ap4A) HIT family hydrolase